MAGFQERLNRALESRRELDLYRHRLTLESPQGPMVRLGGREYLNFCSNDYLGLASHPRVVEALQRDGVTRIVECGPGLSLTQNGRFITPSIRYTNAKKAGRWLAV